MEKLTITVNDNVIEIPRPIVYDLPDPSDDRKQLLRLTYVNILDFYKFLINISPYWEHEFTLKKDDEIVIDNVKLRMWKIEKTDDYYILSIIIKK